MKDKNKNEIHTCLEFHSSDLQVKGWKSSYGVSLVGIILYPSFSSYKYVCVCLPAYACVHVFAYFLSLDTFCRLNKFCGGQQRIETCRELTLRTSQRKIKENIIWANMDICELGVHVCDNNFFFIYLFEYNFFKQIKKL